MILLNRTPLALWQGIIQEAEASCEINLMEELEAYLVYLMIRYTNKPEFVKHIMANDLLAGLKLPSAGKQVALQEVGDKCLLFTGLFPNISTKRLVKLSYFVSIGQSAYGAISHDTDDLYHSLAVSFVPMVDVLQSVRHYTDQNPDLLPLQAYELWNETGSQRALKILKKYTKGTPIKKQL